MGAGAREDFHAAFKCRPSAPSWLGASRDKSPSPYGQTNTTENTTLPQSSNMGNKIVPDLTEFRNFSFSSSVRQLFSFSYCDSSCVVLLL